MLSSNLTVALKEWNVVCEALQTGRQIILLRKGGILESASGFEVEHGQFLLYPTYVHQNPTMLKPAAQQGLQTVATEPARITLSAAAGVTDIVRLKYREQMDALYSEHIWTAPLIDMRFNYKPQNPLYLLMVRAYSLAQPITIDNTPEYAGCKSWVPLTEAIDVGRPAPALDDANYEQVRQKVLSGLA